MFGLFSKKDKYGWESPAEKIPVNAKNVHHKKYICKGDEMVDAILVSSGMNAKTPIYSSKNQKYYRKENYNPKFRTISGELIIPDSVRFYTAVRRPGLDYCKSSRTRKNVVYLSNRQREKEKYNKLRENKYKLDLADYQERLSKRETNKEAVEELRLFQSIIKDAHGMDDRALAKKYEKIMMAAKISGFASMIFGAAAAGVGLAGTLSNSASQSLKLSNSITSKVGKLANLGQKFGHGYNWTSFTIGAKASADVAGKAAGLIILGAAANLTIPGATLTCLAIVSAATSAGFKIAGEQVMKKKMAIQMNSENLVQSIDEMIANNGTFFYKENNPMFQEAVGIKEELDGILNTTENDNVINALNTFQANDKATAAQLLEDMMTNAANASRNAAFEQELQKSKVMEKVNNATLQKLRNRRAKLKRLANLTRKNKPAQ